MPTKTSKKPAKTQRQLSRDELAEELDVHSETVGRYDRDGAPFERRGRANFYNAPEYRAWMKSKGRTGKEGRPSHAADSPDLEAARLRKENALASKYELQVQRERAELVPSEDVKQWIGQNIITMRNKLIGLGASVAPQLEGRDSAERQGIIDARVEEYLNELAATVAGVGRGA